MVVSKTDGAPINMVLGRENQVETSVTVGVVKKIREVQHNVRVCEKGEASEFKEGTCQTTYGIKKFVRE